MIRGMSPQDPLPPATDATAPASELVQQLQALGWVDHTAIAVLLVFFVLGLFKGLIWQVSRIAILVVAYVVAGRFGHDVAALLGSGPPEQVAQDAMQDAAFAPGEATLYTAYVLLFLVVLVVLSLLSMLIKKLADKAGLSFFDRLGGGMLGVATGACVVLALVFAINMVFPQGQIAEAARSSHSLRFSQQAIEWLGGAVNDDLRSLLQLRPLQPHNGAGAPTPPPVEGQPSRPRPMAPGAIPLPGTPTPAEPTPPQPTGPQPGGGNR